MNKHFIVLLLLAVSIRTFSQDAYHNWLNNQLQTTYSLPSLQTWILPDSEDATFVGSTNYGGSTAVITPMNQPFTMGRSRTVTLGVNPWDAGHTRKNTAAIAQGDKCLVIFWLRSETPNAKVNIFAENITTYDKEVISTVNVGNTWKMYAAPFESTAAYPVNGMQIGLHLAHGNQTIEIGGAACLNYKNTVFFTALPVLLNNDTYPGQEPNAPWRAEANASIEQIRKANLNIQVLGPNGQPIPDAQVHVAMQQHEFKFGTAVVSNKFNGGSAFNATYEAKLLDLDGNGHGFNELVFENDLKWPAWEQSWFSSKPAIADDVQWMKDHGISVRGHNLAWPGWGYSPSDINATATPAFIKNRIRNHLITILNYPGIGQEMIDWDVLNEITSNNDYANKFAGTPGYPTGRELYAEIFKQADSLAPNTTLYLNDYVAIEQGDSPSNGISTWKSRIDELIAAGAPLEGIGFQGHFSTAPTGIQRVKDIYDEFWNAYGLESKVTEYDVNKLVPAATQADYMRDFLTVTFAHPSTKGFLMWGFWDGAHWQGNAPIFKEDWTLKPSGEAFVNQVFHQWWTDSLLTTSNTGETSLRGFKGTYQVTVLCPDGSSQSETLELKGDQSLTINTACLVSSGEPQTSHLGLNCTPNPAHDRSTVTWNNTGFQGKTTLRMMDIMGREITVLTLPVNATRILMDVSNRSSGMYLLSVENNGMREMIRMVVQ